MDTSLKDLQAGKVKLHALEQTVFERTYGNQPNCWPDACRDAATLRLQYIEGALKKDFPRIKAGFLDTSGKGTTGIEQKIGGACVPLGLGGPLTVKGQYASGDYWLPCATNEAALVAGLSRGCKAANAGGGVTVRVVRDGMARAPLVETPSIEKAHFLAEEIRKKGDLFEKIKAAAEAESKVSKLLDIHPFQQGRAVHLRFTFQTGDSMGMNSATKYSALGIKALLEAQPELRLITLTGNMDTDKKAAHTNVLLGRGKSVEAECEIPGETIQKIFDVKPEAIVNLIFKKCYRGSALAGTVTGYNLNAANTVAAMFISTGQDAAQVVESSTCFTSAEVNEGKLLFSVSLPCLEVATVGGGTGWGTAKECLEILGCAGPGKNPGDHSRKLAEIIASAVLAQELNLAAAQAHEYELAESHIKLARGK